MIGSGVPETDREIVARLYFVDTPEADTAYRDRLDEQAAYFGIRRAQAVEIAHEAAAFTKKRLAAPLAAGRTVHRLDALAGCLGAFCARASVLHHHRRER